MVRNLKWIKNNYKKVYLGQICVSHLHKRGSLDWRGNTRMNDISVLRYVVSLFAITLQSRIEFGPWYGWLTSRHNIFRRNPSQDILPLIRRCLYEKKIQSLRFFSQCNTLNKIWYILKWLIELGNFFHKLMEWSQLWKVFHHQLQVISRHRQAKLWIFGR